jgi:hypothetical protein
MITGAVNRSPGIYLMAEEYHGKLQLGDIIIIIIITGIIGEPL